MGLLDHRRTWHYDVAATPSACIDAFKAAFSGRGGLVTKARWEISSRGDSATAVYGGRKGLGALAGGMSRVSAQEADTALGSEVRFTIDGTSGGRTRCSMHLALSGRSGVGGMVGMTSDARFIRPYMQAVADRLRELDPSAQIQTA